MAPQIDAVILAGGMARRMDGNDKGLVDLNGQAMICHTIDKLSSQVDNIMINANRNQVTATLHALCPFSTHFMSLIFTMTLDYFTIGSRPLPMDGRPKIGRLKNKMESDWEGRIASMETWNQN